MQAEIQGGKNVLRNLSSKQHKLDIEVLKLQEVLYTQVKYLGGAVRLRCGCTIQGLCIYSYSSFTNHQ